jgi:hypothetical protein
LFSLAFDDLLLIRQWKFLEIIERFNRSDVDVSGFELTRPEAVTRHDRLQQFYKSP